MWSPVEGRLLWSADGVSRTGAVAFAPDGRTVAAGGYGVVLLDVETGRALPRPAANHQLVTELAFVPDGRAVACTAGAEVRLYPVAGRSPSGSHVLKPGEGFPLFSLAFSPDGDTIVAGGAQGMLYLWRPSKSIHTRSVQLGAGDLRSVAYSPDGQLVAVASRHSRTAPTDDFIALVDPGDGRLLWRADAHPGGALCVAFAGGKELVSAGRDGTIKRWRVSRDADDE
jgi:WD40 repeat protein